MFELVSTLVLLTLYYFRTSFLSFEVTHSFPLLSPIQTWGQLYEWCPSAFLLPCDFLQAGHHGISIGIPLPFIKLRFVDIAQLFGHDGGHGGHGGYGGGHGGGLSFRTQWRTWRILNFIFINRGKVFRFQ
ncbi:hypothetical protein CEXT_785161 [Caerostris extrusa]|uniref:Secreted protein n=1 Tax=Caerostris extrusa TaxID=172846 RepID=A0AAV4R9H7_CAEEX|nr:hypothetical protein CEXT_785161 [Caerostris extrusa]